MIYDWSPRYTPVIGPDGGYYLCGGEALYTFDPGNGEVLRSLETPGRVTSHSPAVDREGIIYLGTDRGLCAITSSGELAWHRELEVAGTFSPVIGSDGTIYCGTRDGSGTPHPALFAFDKEGNLKWSLVSDDGAAAPVVGTGDIIYWPVTGGVILAVDQAGRLDWRFELSRGEWASEAATLTGDGLLLMGTDTGRLYAIRTGSRGLAASVWPRYRGNNLADGRVRD